MAKIPLHLVAIQILAALYIVKWDTHTKLDCVMESNMASQLKEIANANSVTVDSY